MLRKRKGPAVTYTAQLPNTGTRRTAAGPATAQDGGARTRVGDFVEEYPIYPFITQHYCNRDTFHI